MKVYLVPKSIKIMFICLKWQIDNNPRARRTGFAQCGLHLLCGLRVIAHERIYPVQGRSQLVPRGGKLNYLYIVEIILQVYIVDIGPSQVSSCVYFFIFRTTLVKVLVPQSCHCQCEPEGQRLRVSLGFLRKKTIQKRWIVVFLLKRNVLN